MGRLDTRTPFDDLTGLREVLSLSEIAEMTGLRRETLSRARADSRFQQRTAKGLHDLYVVVSRLRPMVDGDVHLAAILRRPQPEFARRSIARVLRDGQVDAVLKYLDQPEPTDQEELENFELPPEIVAELEASGREERPRPPVEDPTLAERVSTLLAADPKLSSRLPEIEAKVLEYFGPGARVERKIIEPWDIPDGHDEFYLRVRTDLSVREQIDRLSAVLEGEQDLLGPFLDRLTIGFLG
jgi:DNA-binding Lrp family transcriptional regulator